MSSKIILCLLTIVLLTSACDQKNKDVVMPLSANNFPQIISFSDEGDGALEDEDKFNFKLTLNDRVDSTGDELSGKVIPLNADVTVAFEVADFEGFNKIADYISDVDAFYEVDDCTTQSVSVQFNANTGKGTVTFPKNVEEIEIEFETNDNLFDDNVLNTTDRNLTFQLTGVTGNGNVTYNKAAEFTYEVLDDESIHGEWEVDHKNAVEFAAFKTLFGLISDDVKNLNAADINEIKINIEYDEVKVEIELNETETVTECGVTSVENKVIEIEASIEELSTKTLSGDIEFAEEIEQSNGSFEEFIYKGSFTISGNLLGLRLKGEYNGTETASITLNFKK